MVDNPIRLLVEALERCAHGVERRRDETGVYFYCSQCDDVNTEDPCSHAIAARALEAWKQAPLLSEREELRSEVAEMVAHLYCDDDPDDDDQLCAREILRIVEWFLAFPRSVAKPETMKATP